MLDNIQTTRCGDIEALDHALSYVLPAVLDARRGRATEGGSELHSPLMGFRPRRPAESTTRLDSASSASRNGDGEEVSRSHSASAYASAAATVFSRSKPKARPVRLLVIDSITALLRGAETSFSSTSAGLTQRSRHLCLIADKLKALAVEYELAVLVINQVSDVFSRPYPNAVPASSSSSRPSSPASASMGAGMSSQRQSAVGAGQWTASQHPGHSQAFYTEGDDPPMRYATQARWFSGQSRLLAKEASLGIVWANAINTRIMLSRTGRRRMLNPQDLSAIKRRRANEDDDGDGVGADVTHGSVAVAADIKPTLIRRAHLVFSPFAPPGTIDFAITPSGVHTLRDSYKLDEAGDAIRARTRAAMRRRQHEASDGHEDAEVGASTGRGAAGAATTRADDGDRGAGDGDGDGPNGDGDDDDEFGGDVFDDFGELPPEFWDGTWETPGAGDEPLATGVGVT
jgi:DNA repair protein RAD57